MTPRSRGTAPTSERSVRVWLLVLDITALAVASAGAYVLRYHTHLAEPVGAPPLYFVFDTSLLLGGCALVCLRALGTGRVRQVWRPLELAFSVALALLAAAALFAGLSLIGARFFHRLYAVYLVTLGIPLILLGRYLVHEIIMARFRRGSGLRERRLVFIGESPLTRAILRQIERHPALGYRVVETFPVDAAGDPAEMRRIIGMLRDKSADEVLFGTAPGSYQDLVELVALFRGTGAEVKRALDVVLSALGLICLSPVFAAIAVAIKLDSSGPVFFRRRCVGRGGLAFDVLKFRSMVADAHRILEQTPEFLEEYRRSLKVKDDPRITRVGRILRRTSLDELPQLVNVFRGEMSLVGPRMLGDIELEKYGDFRDKVLSIRPGITGLWQVSGRHETTFEERVALDNDYIDRWSIGLDFRILYRTIPEVLRMRGAQ